jgi:hypothetical protein
MSDETSADGREHRIDRSSEPEMRGSPPGERTARRRQFLAAGGVATGGALLGTAQKPVTAAASTSDGDDDHGSPSSRIDVFADGIDSNSASIDEVYMVDRHPDVVVSEHSGTIRAVDSDGVIDTGTDAGAVFDAIFANAPTGSHVHMVGGTYDFDTQSTASKGYRITGNWRATEVRATSSINACWKFEAPGTNIGNGPIVEYLFATGMNENADYLVEFDAIDDGAVTNVHGREFGQAIVYGHPDDGNQNLDNTVFRELRAHDCNVVEFVGTSENRVADCKVERVAANNPQTYAVVLDSCTRITVERAFAGVSDGNDGSGTVLVTNTNDQCEGCDLYRIELEDTKSTHDGIAAHFEQAPGSTALNWQHELHRYRATTRGDERCVVVDSTNASYKTQDITIGDPLKSLNPGQIVLNDTRHCSVEYHRYDDDPWAVVDVKNGDVGNLVNGISDNGNHDPTAGNGIWGANPEEGVVVENTTHGAMYLRARGEWHQLVPIGPTDLSTVTPDHLEQRAVDDGTNTGSGYREYAHAIDSSGDGTADSWLTTGGDVV